MAYYTTLYRTINLSSTQNVNCHFHVYFVIYCLSYFWGISFRSQIQIVYDKMNWFIGNFRIRRIKNNKLVSVSLKSTRVTCHIKIQVTLKGRMKEELIMIFLLRQNSGSFQTIKKIRWIHFEFVLNIILHM